MTITKQPSPTNRCVSHHELTLAQLVDWAEQVIWMANWPNVCQTLSSVVAASAWRRARVWLAWMIAKIAS